MESHNTSHPHKGLFVGSEGNLQLPKIEAQYTFPGTYDNKYQLSLICCQLKSLNGKEMSFSYRFEGSIQLGEEYLKHIGYDYKRITYFLEVQYLKWTMVEEKIISFIPSEKKNILTQEVNEFILKMRQHTLPARILEMIQTLFQKKHLEI